MLDLFLDWAGYWLLRLLTVVFQRLSLERGLAVGRILGGWAYCLIPRRRVVYTNLKAAFPESSALERKCWTKNSFQHLGMMAVEILRSPKLTPEDLERLVQTRGYEDYIKRYESGEGLILLTAHLGNWELSQIVEGLRGRLMTVLARRQKMKRLDAFLNSFRQNLGTLSVGKEKGGIRDLIRTLREGGCVGMLGDQAGGNDGVWVRFFGRLVTAPRGPLALALKTGVSVYPTFFIRRHGPYHELVFEPPLELVRTGDWEKDITVNTQKYIDRLESYLTRFPSQWLWGHKRWKKTRTKRITILSDGKPGHVKQSEALVKEWLETGKDKNPPYEFQVEKVEVRFRGPWSKRLFHLFAFFFIPWAQGRLSWLRPFFTDECMKKIEKTNPDLIVSAGASLAPLNLCLSRENLGKSVILMKPSFPYNLSRYDLALIPFHDRGLLPPRSVRVQGALSGMDSNTLEASGRVLAHTLRDPKKVRISFFLGGETRNFKPSLSDVESILSEIEQASQRLGGDFLVTTSRRTPEPINQFIRSQLGSHPRCQLCVIGSEDGRPEVVPGMMALADFLVVTEDSLSMISEAISSSKPVVVVKMGVDGLPKKHYRFQELVEKELGIPVVETKRLCDVLSKREAKSAAAHFSQERARIREKLESLL